MLCKVSLNSDLHLAIEAVDGSIVIKLSDSGPGVDTELMPQLFEPFVTSKTIGDGLGLGLAIVKSIVRDLNGDIEVANCHSGGACFMLNFPQTFPQNRNASI